MILLAFAIVLLVAVLVSERADRSVLSTAVIFLLAGFALGRGAFDVLPIGPDHRGELVEALAELALFAVLFTDGMRLGVRDLAAAWRLPGRALLLGMPLAFAMTAGLAWLLTDLNLLEAALLGAVLAPTDPVFASAIVGREEVPAPLRNLLNVESGINDGLALPVVVVLLAMLGAAGGTSTAIVVGELALGVVIGVAVPWIVIRLEGTRRLAASANYRPLLGVTVGLLVFAIGQATHANLFLGAFAAGITMASAGGELARAFHEFGELVAELLKLAALLVFGASISLAFLGEIPPSGWVFALLVLVAVRPAALSLALLGSELDRPQRVAAMWFGPKGFASVVYGLLVIESGIAAADEVFHLAALAIVFSILAHSSTDVLVARWFVRAEGRDDADDARD